METRIRSMELVSAIDAGLSGFADSSYVVVGEPFDVRFEEGFLHILELGFADNCFNLFHTFLIFIFLPVCVYKLSPNTK